MSEPYPVTGYVLAGGKSSRMGQDKALLEFHGKPLIERAVDTLRSVCGSTFILSGREELGAYAPLVPDLHPGCGPLGGIEAALLHTQTEWNLFLAVDMPFVTAALMSEWMGWVLPLPYGRVSFFSADAIPQPALCMVHRESAPFIQAAVRANRYRVLTTLQDAARQLATRFGKTLPEVLLQGDLDRSDFFVNVNTPAEFALAEARRHAGAS